MGTDAMSRWAAASAGASASSSRWPATGLRDALGITAGSTVDISRYGAGLQVTVGGRTARLVEEDGFLVGASETEVDDDTVLALIDAGRR